MAGAEAEAAGEVLEEDEVDPAANTLAARPAMMLADSTALAPPAPQVLTPEALLVIPAVEVQTIAVVAEVLVVMVVVEVVVVKVHAEGSLTAKV